MDEIKKIMVALSLAEFSEEEYLYAANLAKGLDAELLVVNIINSRDVNAVSTITSMGYEVDGDEYVRGVREERKEAIEKILAVSDFPREKIRVVIKVGNPIRELLKMTLKESVDMIVMGPKGKTDLEHVLVGSVAEKLFRRSPVTVVSFRGRKLSERLKKRIHLKLLK